MNEQKILEIIGECKNYNTKDLQNDLALLFDMSSELTEAYKRILISREEKLPYNIQFNYNPFAYLKQDFTFELR